MSNTFGNILKLTTFGESHSKFIGGVLDGFPSNIEIDLNFIQSEIDKRRPNQSFFNSKRNESDTIQILSGIFDNKTLGTPIAFIFENKNTISQDYENIKDVYRPSHADFTYHKKYGIYDYRGGGRSSARDTVNWVAAGAFAKILLQKFDIKIFAYVSQIGHIQTNLYYNTISPEQIYNSPTRCPDPDKAQEMVKLLQQIQAQGDSIGGTITCIIKNAPLGLGQPIFDKFHAQLAKAILSINACKAFEIGKGFDAPKMRGSEFNDQFFSLNSIVNKKTNNNGGVLGGITDGSDIVFRAAFKPTPSISLTQNTINHNLQNTQITIKGRHDTCIVPRANAVVEAMAALVTADFLLWANAYKF